MCVYICMYVYIQYIYMCMYVYIYIYILYICVCMYVYIRAVNNALTQIHFNGTNFFNARLTQRVFPV